MTSTQASHWHTHGNQPVLIPVDNVLWLVYQQLSPEGGQIVARDPRDPAADRLIELSPPGIDCANLAAVSYAGQPHAVWSQLTDGVYQLYERSAAGAAPRQITSDPMPALFPQLAVAADGTLVLAFQRADSHGHYQIWLSRRQGDAWSPPLCATGAPCNHWHPALTACSSGQLALAWDSYAAGSYDICLRFFDSSLSLLPTQRLTADGHFNAHVSLAPAPDGAVWVAWNRGGARWGQDNHPYRRGHMHSYDYLHSWRQLALLRVSPERAWPVAPDLQADVLDPLLPGPYCERPRLFASPAGILAVAFRYNVGDPLGGHRNDTRWQALLTCYDGRTWTAPIELADAYGLSTGALAAAWRSDGAFYAAATGEGGSRQSGAIPYFVWELKGQAREEDASPVTTLETRTYLYRLEAPPQTLRLINPPVTAATYPLLPPPASAPRPQVRLRGEPYQLYYGDLHRHTELSFCRTSVDGSLEEVFRYAQDAAKMDFVMSADHDTQAQSPDIWRETMQAADRFHVPGYFSAFYGYEWIGAHTNRRHRVIVSTRRIAPPPFGFDIVADNEHHRDLRRLWATFTPGQTITIAHHTACNMSLRWGQDPGEAVDPRFEPLVEIFQASRGSSECAGAPSLWNHFARSGQTREMNVEAGMVSTALRQGLRLGFIASSDHMSTHQSYACLWAAANTREALLEAMLARRAYAATDRILCEFSLADAFMGESLPCPSTPLPCRIRFVGTGPIGDITLLRDSQPYRIFHPAAAEALLEFELPPDECRGHYFYVRMQQQDTNLAWSSPIWIV